VKRFFLTAVALAAGTVASAAEPMPQAPPVRESTTLYDLSAAAIPGAPPAFLSGGSCPGGVCPVQRVVSSFSALPQAPAVQSSAPAAAFAPEHARRTPIRSFIQNQPVRTFLKVLFCR